jgi:hypothetical protein
MKTERAPVNKTNSKDLATKEMYNDDLYVTVNMLDVL